MDDAYKEGSVDFLVCYAIDLYITVQSKFKFLTKFLHSFILLSIIFIM